MRLELRTMRALLPRRVRSFTLLALGAASLAVACSSSTGGKNNATDGGAGAGGGAMNGGDAEPPATLCTVASQGTSGTLLSGKLLLPAGPTMGELLIDATGMIVCADASCSSAAGYGAATHIACATGVISPSLINTHDHTDYATTPPDAHGMTRYQHRSDWRVGAEGATKLPDTKTTDPKVLAAAELRFVLSGATAIVSSAGVNGLLRNLAAFKTPTQLEGLTGKTTFFDTFPLGDLSGGLITSGCAYPKIEAASAAFQDGAYAPHVAEGINLAAENELTCTSMASNNLITSNTSIIHGIGLNAKDVAVVQAAGARLIWSPRSNISLYGNTASVTEYHAAGVKIALGTDWLPSGSMNMLRELACADSMNQKYFHSTFSDQELWEMVTSNAALAAGFDSEIGSLAAGKVADVAIFDETNNTGYRAVIAAEVEDVRLVLRGGKPLYGDTALVNALQNGCTPLPVCGIDRMVCFDVPSVALADAQAAIADIYPLFFCKGQDPTGEPSCVPYRDSYPNGTSATDRDGDGIADAMDDCPDVFNPVRPMDNNAQSDVDGDGVGDACDAKPLDPTAH